MTRARLPRPHEVQAAARDPRYLEAQAVTSDPSWRTKGRCRTVDPETFFPLPTEPADMALALCNACPVKSECLRAALDAGDCEGVWGATTPRERRAMLVAWRNSRQCTATVTTAAAVRGAARGSTRSSTHGKRETSKTETGREKSYSS